ncbi:hypothetical protein BN1356_01964 [Streptococcus varani]|uniref:Uncharacterized protein n=1 Tax=Streptococcus varani TaxID=1608583 RepID=A0A0E3WFJ3_9STRE|nr:hypothetical protein BN1356_01964 [Streptococcus varani]
MKKALSSLLSQRLIGKKIESETEYGERLLS